jgi:Ribosomal RNA adenine dimethylase
MPIELVPAIVRHARDHGSLSDELHFAARDPIEVAHLDHGRANLLRALDIRPDDTVLEVGAEYGALTRYLGERAALVHAIEPDPDRAEVIKARTAGLPGVAVLAERGVDVEYDLAVIAAPPATPGLFRGVRARSFAIAVDDAQTCDAMAAGLRAAGLAEPRVLSCVPNRRVTRAVLSQELTAEQPRLAAALAGGSPRPDYLLVVGDRWPAARLASYFNTSHRAAIWCTRADVQRSAEGAEVRHRTLLPDPLRVAGISVRDFTDPVRDAPTMLEVILEEPWRVTELLTGWRELVSAYNGSAMWDLVPHNVLVDGQALYPIDLEWEHAHAGEREVIERGLLVLAHYLTEAGWAGAAGDGTMRELAGWLGVLLGFHPSYVDEAVAREVAFGVIGVCGTDRASAPVRDGVRQIWDRRLAQRPTRYGSRELAGQSENGKPAR